MCGLQPPRRPFAAGKGDAVEGPPVAGEMEKSLAMVICPEIRAATAISAGKQFPEAAGAQTQALAAQQRNNTFNSSVPLAGFNRCEADSAVSDGY